MLHEKSWYANNTPTIISTEYNTSVTKSSYMRCLNSHSVTMEFWHTKKTVRKRKQIHIISFYRGISIHNWYPPKKESKVKIRISSKSIFFVVLKPLLWNYIFFNIIFVTETINSSYARLDYMLFLCICILYYIKGWNSNCFSITSNSLSWQIKNNKKIKSIAFCYC